MRNISLIKSDYTSTISNGVMWNTSKYLKVGQTNAIGRAILCLINSQKPKDFYDDSTVGYGDGTADSQIHHIFPEAEYKDSVDNTTLQLYK